MPDPAEIGIVFTAAHRRGGVERVAVDVLRHLARHRRTAFIGEDADRAALPGVEVFPVHTARGLHVTRPFRFRAAAAQTLARHRPRALVSFGVTCPPGDVFWVHSVHRAWVQRGGSVSAAGITVPAAARRLMPKHRVLLELERQYFTRHHPRRILCTSEQEKTDLADFYDVDAGVVTVVPNGFDGDRFSAETRIQWREPMRHRIGARDDDVVVLFVANELHRKGFRQLLDAVARLADARVRIDVVGRTPLDAYTGHLDRLGLTGRVHWHGASAEVERYMAAGDVLVLPTQYEPFGLVIVEALATGLPVITTRLAGAAPALVDGGTGLLQDDPLDDLELTALLRAALSDATTLSRWSAAAPESVLDYEWSAIVRRVESLIADVC